MGRGRQKAKQTKVARKLKYYSPETDYERLQRELHGEPLVGAPSRPPEATDDTEDDEYVDPYADSYADGDDEWVADGRR